jgi:pimeloyl-ACP methyl ester carboxylesterase
MRPTPNLAFIHGMFSSSKGYKATLLRRLFPDMLIPDFSGTLEERMAQLEPLLSEHSPWILIGSSMGGLMAALYAARHPQRLARLILLAPALTLPGAPHPDEPIAVQTVVIHGKDDQVIPLEAVLPLCEKLFPNLQFHTVADDHPLRATSDALDWRALVLEGQFRQRPQAASP